MASETKAKQLVREVQCVPGLVEKTKHLLECMSIIKTAARLKDTKRGKRPATRWKTKKGDVKAEVQQTCVNLDAKNVHMTEL